MLTVKKLSMAIAGAVFSAFSLGLEAAHALGDFLLVPPDAAGRPSYYVSGGRYTFLATGEQTNGQFSLFDYFVPPEAGPPTHVHAREDESLYILEGNLTVQMGDQSTVQNPGSFSYLPLGRLHAFQNLETSPARTLAFATPPGLENFFAEVGQPVTDKDAPPPPEPDFEQLMPIAIRYGILPPTDIMNAPTPTEDFLIVPPDAAGRESFSIADNLYTSLATKEENGGRYSLFEVSLPPPNGAGLLQSNDQESNSFYILDGNLNFQIEDQTVVATPGTFLYIPEDTPYSYQNSGTTPARTLLFTATPVPEPSSALGILEFGAFGGAGLMLKRKQKKQKSANLDASTVTI